MYMIEDLYVFLPVLYIALAVWVTIHAVLNKRDTRAAIGWTALTWLAPIIGSLAYYILGINRIQRKATRMGLADALKNAPEFQFEEADIERANLAREAYPTLSGLAEVGQRLTGKSILPGNQIVTLIDGDQTYPAMVDAIQQAEVSINLLSYIFDSDRAGDLLVDALCDAKNRGVIVRVLVDDVGSKYSKVSIVKRLASEGITVRSFLPTRFGRIPQFTNLRNHRKLLIVDGKIGFTGGTNIREAHYLSLEPKNPTQCLHFKITGPVVAQLQETFAVDWAFTTGEQLVGKEWFPPLGRKGETWARGISHGPDEDFDKLSKVIFAALATAQDRVRIVTPYFLPDGRLSEALIGASLRGVSVEVYLPSNNNVPVVEWAAKSYLKFLMEYGCRVFVTRPPFDHTKVMVCDDNWSLIGSTNWDPRSLRLNFEFNLECYDEDFNGRLQQVIDDKAKGASEITIEQLESRSFAARLRDGLARLASPYL